LLRSAFKLGAAVAIGLTTDKMLEFKAQKELIQPYEERYANLEEFISSECDSDRSTIFPISTKEGGADHMIDLEALVTSDEISVVQNAFDINELRVKNGLKRFHIIVIPRVRTKDGQPLSSSRIRAGDVFQGKDLVY
jgi:pantetheine-phosphate adenylyltransferase